MKELEIRLQAGYPAIKLLTHEEARAEAVIAQVCKKLEKVPHVWTITEGLKDKTGSAVGSETDDPTGVLKALDGLIEEGNLFVLKDFHHYLEEAVVVRMIRDLIPRLKAEGAHIIFLGASFNAPIDLMREIVEVEFKLPDRAELHEVLKNLCEENDVDLKKIKNGEMDKLIEAGLGLTSIEYENALAESLVEMGKLCADNISKVKSKIVASSGSLEVARCEDLPEVGGNKVLMRWMEQRGKLFSKKFREYKGRVPKGVLLVGPPGTGKSLVGKSASKFLDLPFTWYLSMQNLLDKFVGESEKNLRESLAAAEASAPCAVVIDEIDKSGVGSGGQESHEVSKNMLGTLLTWMQDRPRDKMVFLVFTANTIKGIPAPLLRKGRIDEIFLVGLPNVYERREIIEIHLRHRDRDPENFKVSALAEACDQFTGAEIEAAIEEAMAQAFVDGEREFNNKDIVDEFTKSKPQALLKPEAFKEFDNWIKKGTARSASEEEEKAKGGVGKRKIKKKV
jgi:AAA+ superfamily predicted ATPase